MLRATLRGILAHKVRLALTAVSVVLSVAFVAGAFVLTDTINHTFDRLFTEVQAGTDVSVRARSGFGDDTTGNFDRATVPESALARVRAVPGVKAAEGGVGGFAQLAIDGKAVTTAGAPTLGFSWTQTLELSPLRLRSGRAPAAPGEVVVDALIAKSKHLSVGSKVSVLSRDGSEEFTVVGIAGFGAADNLAGATLAIFELRTAQRLFGKVGGFDTIDIVATQEVSARELQLRIAAVLPAGTEAITGDQVAAESANAVKQGLSFFGTFLLTFAGISMFVGAFIIFNTFSILVAQRTRELALLRALGAGRGQVMASVVVEALVVGATASLIGLAAGVGMAVGLQALLRAFGLALPTTQTQFLPRTVIVSLLVGTVVTVVSSLAPARKASRVSPVAALRENVVEPGGSMRRRTMAGLAVSGAGAAALIAGLFAGKGISLVGLGAALTFVGVAMLSPLVARPLASAIGAPLVRIARVSAKLGRENAMRNPRRTAATAAALMIGLGLVGCVSVLGASAKESATAIFDRSLSADFAVTTESFMPSISPKVADRLGRLSQLAAVSGFKQGEVRPLTGEPQVAGGDSGPGTVTKQMTAGDPAGLSQVLNIDVVAGDYASLARGDLLVEEREAKARSWKVGDTVTVRFARTGDQTFRVGAIFARNELAGRYLVSNSVFEANFTEALDFLVLSKIAPGVTPAAARTAIEGAVTDFPNLKVQDQTQVKAEQAKQVDQALSLISALLGLAIVIALLGIVNTLALSVFERTRELGLLRAVGMARRQVRSMVRSESVIIAVLGAILGLAVGTLFGWAIVASLSSQGFTELAIPVGQLMFYVVLAAVAGVLAAVTPARRAARLDVLAAISYE